MTSVVYYQRLCTQNVNKQLKVKCREDQKILSVGQRDSIVELIRGGNSYGEVASMLKIPKTTVYNILKGMIHGVVQKMTKNCGEDKV